MMDDKLNFENHSNFIGDIMKAVQRVQETQDEFIFETISSWLHETQQIKISKKELIEAITFYRQAKITPMEHVRVNCTLSDISHNKLIEIGELEDCVLTHFYSELTPYIKKYMKSHHDDILDATTYSLDLYMKNKEEWTNDRSDGVTY